MRLLTAAAFVLSLASGAAHAATDIDFFFPVPVQGKLAVEMQRIVGVFNAQNPDVHVTAVYTGSYDDTNLKTRAAIKAGHPPAAVIMSANFIREYVINDEVESLNDVIRQGNQTPDAFMAEFWPVLRINATENGHVFGVPFQNSTSLLYYSVAAFEEAGLDPNHPPATWDEWVADLKKLVKRDGNQVTRWGVMIPGTYDYLGWIASGLTMSNGGEYYNHSWGGEVYYNQPSTIGAVQLLDDFVHKYKVMPEGITDTNAMTTAFFAGKTAMMVLSTGSLSFVRENMKLPYRTAFMPAQLRHATPIGGGSLIIPKGNSPERRAAAWKLITYLTSPAVAGDWSRFTGYFAPRIAAYDLPEMKEYLAAHPDAKVAVDQLQYAEPWFATFNTVGVRKAMEDQLQAVLSGKIAPRAAMEAAQKEADGLLRPYVDQTALKLPE
jgi:sn-glycerol 3-phosphate transport system substrate-binding protein